MENSSYYETAGLSGDITTYCREHDLDKSLFCAILRQFDFERVQFLKNMEDYSEGQKNKILLATSLLTPAHLYIWDEPLNYIDIFSRMQIEKLLLTYQPTMLFVEHDVRFCEKNCNANEPCHSLTSEPCRQPRNRLLGVAAFAVCVFARMCLPVSKLPVDTFGSFTHCSLQRAKFLLRLFVARDTLNHSKCKLGVISFVGRKARLLI